MSIIRFTLSFLFFFTFYFQNVHGVPTNHVCRPEQRDALLEFKNEFWMKCNSSGLFTPRFPFPSPNMESWENNSDCCYWEGVWCDPKTREVVDLHLHRSCLHGRFHSNISLFRLLSHLTSLRLSDNTLSGHIPSSIGNLSHLTSLDLRSNQFSGQIPSSIGKLSHLTYLHLSENSFVGEIPSSLGSLKQLTSLDLGSNKLSGNFPITLLNLTNLSNLMLSNNQITGMLPPNISLLSSLYIFDASNNAFVGTLPSSLFTIPYLVFICLQNNQLNHISEFGEIKLEILLLGGNKFRGPIPTSISKLTNLELLGLSHWNTQGPVNISIFSHFKSLTDLTLSNLNTTTTIDLNAISSYSKSLETLDLSGNHVLTTNKSSVSDPPSQLIKDLNLSNCSITEFPELLRIQQRMWFLDISNNRIKGQVPVWLLMLPQLYDLNLSNNTFISFERSMKHGLSSVLRTLDISNNKIKGQVPGWLWTQPQLKYVNLSNNTFIGFERSMNLGLSSVLWYLFGSKNNFTGNIPSLICELNSLRILDLSDNNFNGPIPLCMENLKGNLSVLNLRQNHLSGSLPGSVFKSLRSLDVGHNQLVGKLPRSLNHFSTLEVFNVESNRINDTFPFWLSSLQKLQVLVLRSNAFHGPVHQASFFTLKIIDISHNYFNGSLPSDYFVNWSNMSSLGTNEDQSDVKYMGDGYYQDSVVLMIKGVEIEMVRILTVDAAVDFSRNRFDGEIPRSISLLKELRLLNLSSNAFTGHIPSSMGNMTALESLDVSQNKLSGEIPQELGNLSFLAYMDFSHNQLVGLVPGGTQFRRQKCSSFEDNSGLFGPALDDDCRDIHTPLPQQYETPEAEEKEEVFSWIAAAIGFGPGIAFGLIIGYILVSYKPEWFTSPFGRNKRRRGSTTTH